MSHFGILRRLSALELGALAISGKRSDASAERRPGARLYLSEMIWTETRDPDVSRETRLATLLNLVRVN